jgi:hypothetical protein
MSPPLAPGARITRTGFFQALFAPCDGMIELRAFPSAARCFAVLGDGGRGGQFIVTHDAEDVYMGVATRRDVSGGSLANCQHLGALFTDVDFKTTPEANIRERLAHALLPPSAIVHSGGGLHCYWFLREPLVLPEEAPRAKLLLRRLAAYLGGDLAAAEPARILRVPGTWNRKPEYSPSRLVQLEPCDLSRRYNASELDEWLPDEPAGELRSGPFVMPERVREGERNTTCFRAARSLLAQGFSEAEVTAAVTTTNQTKCQPPLPDAELAKVLANAARLPHDPTTWRGAATNGAPPVPSTATSGAVVTQLSTIEPEVVAWLWPARVARGKITVLAGDPGLGKSFVTLDVAARITTGRPWPDGGAVEPGDVVLLSAEDGPADTIRPRIDALGGDPTRVYLVRAIRDADGERPVSLDRDLAAVERDCAPRTGGD